MSDPTEKMRARARLALKSEQAFGLDFMMRQAGPLGPGVPEVTEEQPQPQSHPDLKVRLEKPASDLFGNRAGAASTPQLSILKAPRFSTAEKISYLKVLNDAEVSVCRKCRLCQTRTNTVFGEGDPDAKIFFIGEGPGENEDLQGRPFVGRAGELLNKWIAAMGLKREAVYIANIVKCRPPGNREPAPDEVSTCTPYLEKQLEMIRPQVIITLGKPAAQHMLQSKLAMGKMRGQWHDWRGIKLMPTYHPAYVLRNYTYETRAAVWSDLQQVMAEVGLPIPKRTGEK